ncbi:HPr kinase [Gloeobacter kilaueensis]|uniref:HPr kinase n=1 Tax=Gloeobacter kilaueensis (strain ATCC BAA-2537 / CCAP 1431/1 / ULC 316 / JS1) TaxID=1183438 RepID=U5QJH6_GLOK1|nr:HPr kinase [Gloeobacter kilaueensis]AGY59071.1 HPr kinase [Gloeobacter kilaueensis JS1]
MAMLKANRASSVLDTLAEIAYRELQPALKAEQVCLRSVDALPVALDGRGLSEEIFAGERGGRRWLAWSETVGVWIDEDGQRVEILLVNPEAGQCESSLLNFMTASVLGTCLLLQGRVAVHANAVAFKEGAMAFVGHAGRGKSTLSAYCLSQGAALVSDDVLSVDRQMQAIPGYARLKLFAHTAESLGLVAGTTDYKLHLHPTRLGGQVQNQPVPLKAIYLLEQSDGDRIESRTVPPAQAVFELIAHSYYARYFAVTHPGLLAAYAELVARVPVEQLFYPRQFARLPDVFAFLRTRTWQRSAPGVHS